MENQLALQLHNRKIFHHYLHQFTPKQLNTIPEGFNNNMLWNIAHTMVVEQMLLYGRCRLPLHVPKEWVGLFQKGTKPERLLTEEEIQAIDKALFSTFEQLEADVIADKFELLPPYTTSTKMVLDSLESTLSFIAFHDGIHLGSVLALAKKV